MAKKKIIFECTSCGYQTPKWVGKCPQCNGWNSFVENSEDELKKKLVIHKTSVDFMLSEIQPHDVPRFEVDISEVNRVFGGGIVPGSVIVIGGAPGIGKSTLILQILKSYSKASQPTYYISGEESPEQIKLRADRLNATSTFITISTEIEIEHIVHKLLERKPAAVVIDSIQTVFSNEIESVPGSLVQIRHCTFQLVKFAKENHIPVFIIGHITKEGQIAGPKILEHMVDVVLYFEGEQHSNYRLLRTFKNRFGATNEIGLFSMTADGLAEETDPSVHFLNQHNESGVAVCCVREGTRLIFIEVQALVSKATYGVPQRVANGFDQKRLAVIIAVLEKKAGLFLGDQDVFVKVSGAMKISDPALDTAIATAIWSSFAGQPVQRDMVCFGELSLTGNIQLTQLTDDRIKDAKTYGFKSVACVPNDSMDTKKMRFFAILHVRDLQDLFGNAE